MSLNTVKGLPRSGPGTMLQVMPFQCSIRLLKVWLVTCVLPTAQMSFAVTTPTALNWLVSPAWLGLNETAQAGVQVGDTAGPAGRTGGAAGPAPGGNS